MVENVQLLSPNFARIGSYFYSIDASTDLLVQKTDDGTLAFAYPLDTPISTTVRALKWDGESFWSLENQNDSDTDFGFRIRRWIINDFVLTLQQTLNFTTNATDTFESEAFAVETYSRTLATSASTGATVLTLSDNSLLTPGNNLFLGPSTHSSSLGETERVTVVTVGPGGGLGVNQVSIASPLQNNYQVGNTFVFSKNLWIFNNFINKSSASGAVYKADINTGAILSRTAGGEFNGINSALFTKVSSFTGSLASHNKDFLMFIRSANLLFIDVQDSNLTIELSALQNNINSTATEIYNVFDLAIENQTLYRLQNKFTIAGANSTSSTFNYQLATFQPFPTAIALTANPALLPADSGASTSIITATVTDQYGLPFVKSPAATVTFATTGGGSPSNVSPTVVALNANGQASTTYTTGATVGLVEISATVSL